MAGTKRIGSLFMILMLLNSFPLVGGHETAANDIYDDLRHKYLKTITGESSVPLDEYEQLNISQIDQNTENYWSTMNDEGVWDDLQTDSQEKSQAISAMYGRIRAMTLGWAVEGSQYYQNSSLLADIVRGLDWLYVHRYNENTERYGNWFPWELRSPLHLLDITIMLYDELTESQKSNYMNAVQYFASKPVRTGANLIMTCQVIALHGIVTKDSSRIQTASDALSDVFPYVSKGDGFYTDGSFIQHFNIPYAGSYGVELLYGLGSILWLLDGTAWENQDPEKENVYEWVFDTYETGMFEGQLLHANRGRDASRYARDDLLGATRALSAIYYISETADSAVKPALQGLIKYHAEVDKEKFYAALPLWNYQQLRRLVDDENIIPRQKPLGYYQFHNQDIGVLHAEDWTFSLKMHSSRIANYETTNQENLRGWHTSDGMTQIYMKPADYLLNYYSTVDAHRMPGTTVDINRDRPEPQVPNRKISDKDFVGGVHFNKTYGLSSMDFQQHDEPDMDVSAQKSWFVFDEEIVALGTGISSTSGRTIETIVENRAIGSHGDEALTIDGNAKSPTDGWTEQMSNVSWAHLESFGGYFFPNGADLHGLREKRTAESVEINRGSYYNGSDEFDGGTLSSEWSWVRENNANWQLANTVLTIDSMAGTLEGTGSSANSTENILLKDVPRGDFYVSAYIDFLPSQEGQEAGLIIYLNDDDYVLLSRAYTAEGNKIKAVSEVEGSATIQEFPDTYSSPITLKIEKFADRHHLYVVSGGEEVLVTSVDRTYQIPLGENLNWGMLAQSGIHGASSVQVSFDRVEAKHVNHFVTLWSDHGVDPVDESYSYVLLPTMEKAGVEQYAAMPEIEIVKHDEKVHAVEKPSLQLTGATFWESESVNAITSRHSSSMMTEDLGNEMEIFVSDLSQKQSEIIYEINKTGIDVIEKDPEIEMLQLSPTILFKVNTQDSAGKSHFIHISYDPSADELPPNAPVGLKGTYVNQSIELIWNEAVGAVSYEVYRSEQEDKGFSLLSSDITENRFIDSKTDSAKTYYYKVIAVNANGASLDSNVNTVSPDNKTIKDVPVLEDARVRGGIYADENYGSDSVLRLKNAPNVDYKRESYLKFDLQSMDSAFLTSATLYLYGNAAGNNESEVNVFGSYDDSWNESTITWNNKPQADVLAASETVGSIKGWKQFDVTAFVREQLSEDRVVSFGLRNVPNVTNVFDSKEGGMAPYLELEFSSAGSIEAAADAYVRGGDFADENFGSEESLILKNGANASFKRESYLTFDSSSLDGATVSSAMIYMHGRTTGSTEADVMLYTAGSTDWDEEMITWNNKPTADEYIGTFTVEEHLGWQAFDITPFIQERGYLNPVESFVLKSADGRYFIFDSRESSLSPYLYVEIAEDHEPPVTTAAIEPDTPNGRNDWYSVPVSVKLNANDKYSVVETVYSIDSGETWQTYSEPLHWKQDGSYTLQYKSVDQSGNIEDVKTTAFKIDRSAPEITINIPAEKTYETADILSLEISITDTHAGVDLSQTKISLDGIELSQYAEVELYQLPIGLHSLSVSAMDLAGNAIDKIVEFYTAPSKDSMIKLIHMFYDRGWIDTKGIANSLEKQSENQNWNALIREVRALEGKQIDTQAAGYLVRDAKYLRDN